MLQLATWQHQMTTHFLRPSWGQGLSRTVRLVNLYKILGQQEECIVKWRKEKEIFKRHGL